MTTSRQERCPDGAPETTARGVHGALLSDGRQLFLRRMADARRPRRMARAALALDPVRLRMEAEDEVAVAIARVLTVHKPETVGAALGCGRSSAYALVRDASRLIWPLLELAELDHDPDFLERIGRLITLFDQHLAAKRSEAGNRAVYLSGPVQ